MSENLKEALVPIKKEIDELEIMLFELIGSEVSFVRTVADYILKNGGKRLRPILTVICAKMAGCVDKSVYKMAACIEYIHTASLLHDDVIDNAMLRRGQPSTNAKWGNHISVLVGDFFYSRASQLMIDQKNLKILDVVAKSTTATTEGEIFEIMKSSDVTTTQEDYLKIIKNKTAHLFATACQIGGIMSGVSDYFEKSFQEYGLNLGMAFQLADDVLDYTSSEDVFGKTKGVDLREGKLTLPLIRSMGRANEEEVQILKNAIIAESLDQETFTQVKDLIIRYDGFKDTQELARDYIVRAKESLSPFRASLEKDILLSLADYVVHRER
ncbi:polyprenyl synthetase family protein [bacterium]|nr:polyprenyl synthetase family protein [bacterium]MBU1917775.1 polyprenyl synthetase family protein [bacterium]